MHELSICQSIVDVIERKAVDERYSRVMAVWLEIGPLAGVELAALRFSFDAATRGTLAENASLEIIETRAEAWCQACHRAVPVSERFDPCPECGSYPLDITAGDELRIKELEVD